MAFDACPCPNRERLARQVERGLAEKMASQPDLQLRLERPDATTLRVVLTGARATFASPIEFSLRDCSELPQTLVLLVGSWLEQDLGAAVAEPEPAPAPESQRPAAVRERAAGQEDDGAPPRLLVAGAGGGALDMGGAPGRAGPASLAFDLGAEARIAPAWGLALTGGYAPATSIPADPGRIYVQTTTLELAARRTFALGGRLRLDLLAGPALRVMAARSRGFSHDLSASLLDLGVGLRARLMLRVAARGWLTASCGALVRARRDSLFVEGAEAAAEVGAVRAAGGLGLAWELF